MTADTDIVELHKSIEKLRVTFHFTEMIQSIDNLRHHDDIDIRVLYLYYSSLLGDDLDLEDCKKVLLTCPLESHNLYAQSLIRYIRVRDIFYYDKRIQIDNIVHDIYKHSPRLVQDFIDLVLVVNEMQEWSRLAMHLKQHNPIIVERTLYFMLNQANFSSVHNICNMISEHSHLSTHMNPKFVHIMQTFAAIGCSHSPIHNDFLVELILDMQKCFVTPDNTYISSYAFSLYLSHLMSIHHAFMKINRTDVCDHIHTYINFVLKYNE